MSKRSDAIVPIVLAALPQDLADRKAELERVVDDGKVSFVAVGRALAELKANPEFYGPQSFERYAEERFGFRRRHVYQLTCSAAVAEIIDVRNCAHWPNAEGTIRPLTRLINLKTTPEPTQEQSDRIEAAWARACKLAEDEGATVAGRHVKAAVDEITGKPPKIASGTRPAISLEALNEMFEAEDSTFRARYSEMKDELYRFRAAINATIRKAEQMGMGGKIVAVGGAK